MEVDAALGESGDNLCSKVENFPEYIAKWTQESREQLNWKNFV